MKSIPLALLQHKAQPATTLCLIQRIGPLRDGSFLAFTSLDRDVEADPDGTGALVYRASTGMQLSDVQASASLDVDNAETQSLVPIYPVEGITEAMVDSGELDGVEFTVWQINYEAPGDGAEVMASGTIGEVRFASDGLITWENRAISQLLKQNSVCERDSLTCRVKRFGSTYEDERFPCLYDWSQELVPGVPWTEGTVTAVGEETVREFWSTDLTQADKYFAPGLVEWLTGANAGMSREVEAFTATDEGGGYVALSFTTRHAIAVGDTFRIRRDCTRQWAGHNSCQTYKNRPHFRGEPFIPVSDTASLTFPGAGSGSGLGGGGINSPETQPL